MMQQSIQTAVLTGFLWMFCASIATAQNVSEVRIITDPAYPHPESVVTASIDSGITTISGSKISWFIDGRADESYNNKRSISFTLGSAGEDTTVEARVTFPDGEVMNLKHTISPSDVDIIAEPGTYVPEFYEGRSEPLSGAPLRLIAVPQLFSKGSRIPSSELVYTWSVNSSVLFGGPELGRDVAEISMPTFGNATVIVTVRTKDGSQTATRAQSFRSTSPKLIFYRESSLYGPVIVASNAFTIPDEEVTLRGEAFYSRAEGDGGYNWSINGMRVENPSNDPRLITLKKSGSGAKANVSLSYQGDAFSFAQGSVSVSFTDSAFIPSL